jgi:hypothetical protein
MERSKPTWNETTNNDPVKNCIKTTSSKIQKLGIDKIKVICFNALKEQKNLNYKGVVIKTMNEYKMLFGFASGTDEHLGIVTEETSEYFVMKKLKTFMKQPTAQGIVAMAVPFMLSSSLSSKDAPVRVYKNQLGWSIEEKDIDQNLLNEYIQATTGLAVASNLASAKSSLLVK